MAPNKSIAIAEEEKSQQKIIKARSKSQNKIMKKKLIVKLPIKKKKTNTLPLHLAKELKLQLTNEENVVDVIQQTQTETKQKKKVLFRIKAGVKKQPKIRVRSKKDCLNINTAPQLSSETCTDTPHLDNTNIIPAGVKSKPPKKRVYRKKNSLIINTVTPASSAKFTETPHPENSNIIQDPQQSVVKPRKGRPLKKKTVQNNVIAVEVSDNSVTEPPKKRVYRKKNKANPLFTNLNASTAAPEPIVCSPDIQLSSDIEQAARKDNGYQESGAVFPEPKKKRVYRKRCLIKTDRSAMESNSSELNVTDESVVSPIVKKPRKRRVTAENTQISNAHLDSSHQVTALTEATPKPPAKRLHRRKLNRSVSQLNVENTSQIVNNTTETLPTPVTSNITNLPSNPPPIDVNKTDLNVVEDILKKVEVTLQSTSVPKKTLKRPRRVPSSDNKSHTSIENDLIKSTPKRQLNPDTKVLDLIPRLDIAHETDRNNSDKSTKDKLNVPLSSTNFSLLSSTPKSRNKSPIKNLSLKNISQETPNHINWRRSSKNETEASLNNVKNVDTVCINGLMPKLFLVDFKKEAERKELRSLSRSTSVSNSTVTSISTSLREFAKTIEDAISRPASTISSLNEFIVNEKCFSPSKSDPLESVLYKDLELSSMSSSSPCTARTLRSRRNSTRSHSIISTSKKSSSSSPIKSCIGKSSSNTESDSEVTARSRSSMSKPKSCLKSPEIWSLRRTRSSTSTASELSESQPTLWRSTSILSMTSSEPMSTRSSVTTTESQSTHMSKKFKEPSLVNNRSPKYTAVENRSPKKTKPVENKSSPKTSVENKSSKNSVVESRLSKKTTPFKTKSSQKTLVKNKSPKNTTFDDNISSQKTTIVDNESSQNTTLVEINSSDKTAVDNKSSHETTTVNNRSPREPSVASNQPPKPEAVPFNQKLQKFLNFDIDQLISDDEIETTISEEQTDVPIPEKDILTLCSTFKVIPEPQQSSTNTTEQETANYITLDDIKQITDQNDNQDKNFNTIFNKEHQCLNVKDLTFENDTEKNRKAENNKRFSTDISKNYDEDEACSDNDDVISLYAESLSELDLNNSSPKHHMFENDEQPTIHNTPTIIRKSPNIQNCFRTIPPNQPSYTNKIEIPISKEQDSQKTKTICEKQRADSTSIVMNENKTAVTDTDSESNYITHSTTQPIINRPKVTANSSYKLPNTELTRPLQNNKNLNTSISSNDSPSTLNNHFETLANQYYMSNLDKQPPAMAASSSSAIHNNKKQPPPLWMSSLYGKYDKNRKFWKGVCIFNLGGNCQKQNCEFQHREILSVELDCMLKHVPDNVFAQEYLRIKKNDVLRNKYLKTFVSEAIRRNLPRILVEMMFDMVMSKNILTPLNITRELTETILLYFNNQDLNICSDILTYRIQGNTLCEFMLQAIITSQNFSRYKELFVKLTNVIIKTLKKFSTQNTMQFIERISILPFDAKVARALVKMLKYSDRSVMQHKCIDMFEKLICNDESIYNEYIQHKGSVLGLGISRPSTTTYYDSTTFGGKSNTSPDTTNNDCMRSNVDVPSLFATPISSTADTFKKPCDSSQQFQRQNNQNVFKVPPPLQHVRPYGYHYRNPNPDNYYPSPEIFNRQRNPRHHFRHRSPHQFGAKNPFVHRGPRPSN